MELATISQVSKKHNVSTRTLRYYEQIGLLTSTKRDDYSYRTYDEAAIRRLQQIIILRKLRISLKDIAMIVQNESAGKTIEVFHENLKEINDEMETLTTIKSILDLFIMHLSENVGFNIHSTLFNDHAMMQVMDSLTPSKINFKEERSVNGLKNVRIIYLPPVTVASSHFIGENPEDVAGKILDEFIRKTKLQCIKPDLHVYGFNNPSPMAQQDIYGYEFWVTIPDDMDVPAPLIKKRFEGGLYAAHCIKVGDFHEWRLLSEWVNHNDEYILDIREPLGMQGSLEEHLNAYTYYETRIEEAKFKQIDLLIPIKPR